MASGWNSLTGLFSNVQIILIKKTIMKVNFIVIAAYKWHLLATFQPQETITIC